MVLVMITQDLPRTCDWCYCMRRNIEPQILWKSNKDECLWSLQIVGGEIHVDTLTISNNWLMTTLFSCIRRKMSKFDQIVLSGFLYGIFVLHINSPVWKRKKSGKGKKSKQGNEGLVSGKKKAMGAGRKREKIGAVLVARTRLQISMLLPTRTGTSGLNFPKCASFGKKMTLNDILPS